MALKQDDTLSEIQACKGEHIRLSLNQQSQAEASVFSRYRLPYVALPELDLKDIDTTYSLFKKVLKAPLIIGSMTGGSEHGRTINTHLAKAAEHCGVVLALGSQRIALEKNDAKETFELARTHAPNAVIIANMGAVQFNYGHDIKSYQAVVDMIQADALYLHLNPLQEALQLGGDSNFTNLLKKIEALTKSISVPVIVKEVGHGVSGEVAIKLFQAGVAGIDTAGVGGTSYAWIEAERAKNEDFAAWFKSVGIPTDQSIQEVTSAKTVNDQLVIASGGIRSPLDGLKARALGADMFSAAVPFLAPAMQSEQEVIEVIENWKQGLRIAMFTAGVGDWSAAKQLELTND